MTDLDLLILGHSEAARFAFAEARSRRMRARWLGPVEPPLGELLRAWSDRARFVAQARRCGALGIRRAELEFHSREVLAPPPASPDIEIASPRVIGTTGARAARRWIVEASGERIQARRILLACGLEPVIPELPGISAAPRLTIRDLGRVDLPTAILVVGGGSTGVVLARILARLGHRVTLVERADRLLPMEEPEISAAVAGWLQEDGVAVRPALKLVGFESGRPRFESGAEVGQPADGDFPEAAAILFATGVEVASGELGLEALGIHRLGDGAVPCDAQLETRARGVFAIGDARTPGASPASARADARAALAECAGETHAGFATSYEVAFDPVLSRAGSTRDEARRRGLAISARLLERKHAISLLIEDRVGQALGATSIGMEAAESASFLSPRPRLWARLSRIGARLPWRRAVNK